ncbi:1313_t:CDS:2, partial [Dentiscutata erythropus]
NSELTQEEKQSCQERVLRNVEREKELFKRGEPIKCSNCNLTRYSTRYCENCIIKYLKSFFGTWTSGSEIIDEFICECQSNSGLPLHIMEWIPSDQLEDIMPLVKGGISTVYIATWKRGAILDFNESKQEFIYSGPQKVVLKSLNSPDNPYEMAKKFIQIRSGDIVNAYGMTKIKTPDDDFAIVMNYFPDGNLRDYLIKNRATLSLKDKVFAIWHSYQLAREIVCGLKLQMVPEIPNKIQSLIYKCIDEDPLKRPTIEQILDNIKSIYKEIYESEDLVTEYEKKKLYYSPSRIVVKPYTPTLHNSSIIDLNEKIP